LAKFGRRKNPDSEKNAPEAKNFWEILKNTEYSEKYL